MNANFKALTFTCCFDGISKHGIVSVSSVGTWRDKVSQRYFRHGLDTMIEKIEPSGIAFYGKLSEFSFEKIIVREYPITTFLWKNREEDVSYKENQ